MGTALPPVLRITRAALCATVILTAATAALTAPAAGQAAGKADEASILHGAYTAAQATRGEAKYRETCAACHATSEFSGAAFQRKWAGQPIFAFFEHVRTSMPLDNPGGLSRAEYAAVLAYILKLNSYPEGPTELPTEDAALRQIRFEVKPPSQD
jgi:mono/diheme cytochrome c family protein